MNRLGLFTRLGNDFLRLGFRLGQQLIRFLPSFRQPFLIEPVRQFL